MQLNRADRRDVYAVLSAKKHSAGSWARKGLKLTRTGDVPVSLDLTKIVRSTHSALRIAKRGASLVERQAEVCSGEPVFIGTRVPLAQVFEQFRAGVSFSEIAEDYPRLTEEALRYPQLCARLGQAPGRPTKALTLRRTAMEAVGWVIPPKNDRGDKWNFVP